MLIRIPVLFAVAASLLRQAPPAADQNKASVEGIVLNALTGEPLRRAQVVLRLASGRGATAMGGVRAVPRGPGIAASTDASGKFTLAGIDPGRYYLSADRNGFLRADYGAKRQGMAGTPIDLQAGAVKRDLTIKLTPQGIVAGRVFDEEGEPLQNVFVQLLQKRYFSGAQRYVPAASGATNDRGEFRLLDVQPGRYLLVARFRGAMMEGGVDSQTGLGYAPTYYPGVAAAAQAGTVEVAAGRESGGAEMRLQRARLFRISGQVIDASGAPVKQANVQAVVRDNPFISGPSYSFSREPDGRFEIPGVPPGSYTVLARSMEPARDGPPAVAAQSVELGEHNVDGVLLSLTPGVNLGGKVAVEGGGTVKLEAVRVTLAPAVMMLPGASAAAKGDGTFTLENVQPGKYRLTVIQPGGDTYLKSAKLGGQEVDPRELDIAGAQEMIVTLSTAAAKVSGTVATADGPVSQATVVLMPAEEAKRGEGAARMTTTGQDGSFTLNGLAPGDYKVFAWDDIESGAWQDPEFLKPIESKGRAVKLESSAAATLTLEPIPAGQ